MEIDRIIAELDAEIEKLQQARAVIANSGTPTGTTPVRGRARIPGSSARKPARRQLSAAARKRIADAQRKRWAKAKQAKKSAAKKAPRKSAGKAGAKKAAPRAAKKAAPQPKQEAQASSAS